MSVEITLVRHGETEANAAGVWQGTSDSPLTDAGRDQVRRLGERLGGGRYDLVVSSHLGRALESSRAVGSAEVDERWRELHLGSWEGLTQQEIIERDPDISAALGSGEDVAFGGGERVSEMVERLLEAFFELSERLDDGGRALVIGHGGALLTLVSVLLGVDTRGRVLRLTNTGVSTMRVDRGSATMAVFNDSTHLPGAPIRADEGSTHVVVARHGETVANLERRWQGQSGGELTATGNAQAGKLAGVFPQVDVLYSSPLDRARDTARYVGEAHNLDAEEHRGLQELSFGNWEKKTPEEIAEQDPLRWAEFMSGTDVARGGNGETFAQLQERVVGAVGGLIDRHPGKTLGLVSHGGATRALATAVLGMGFAERHRISILGNTAMGRFVYSDRGPALAAWNLAPHLERAS